MEAGLTGDIVIGVPFQAMHLRRRWTVIKLEERLTSTR
jgi:hypothetical protein